MHDRIEVWRLAVAGLAGVALGIVVCIAWPRPSVPFVAVETGSVLPAAVGPTMASSGRRERLEARVIQWPQRRR